MKHKLMCILWQAVGAMTPQRLVTSSIRRNTPACLDSKIHHNNLLNNILAKIQANHAGADDALMLDVHGFVSETNATNFFVVRKGVLITPHADACLPVLSHTAWSVWGVARSVQGVRCGFRV